VTSSLDHVTVEDGKRLSTTADAMY